MERGSAGEEIGAAPSDDTKVAVLSAADHSIVWTSTSERLAQRTSHRHSLQLGMNLGKLCQI